MSSLFVFQEINVLEFPRLWPSTSLTQDYSNRYNLINRAKGICNLYEINKGLWFWCLKDLLWYNKHSNIAPVINILPSLHGQPYGTDQSATIVADWPYDNFWHNIFMNFLVNLLLDPIEMLSTWLKNLGSLIWILLHRRVGLFISTNLNYYLVQHNSNCCLIRELFLKKKYVHNH